MTGSAPPVPVPEDLNPFHIAQQQFEHAIRYLPEFQKGLVDYLVRPERVIISEFPIETSNGTVRNFTGYRVLHNRARGPGKGGIRYHPDVTADEVRALATAIFVLVPSGQDMAVRMPRVSGPLAVRCEMLLCVRRAAAPVIAAPLGSTSSWAPAGTDTGAGSCPLASPAPRASPRPTAAMGGRGGGSTGRPRRCAG